MAKRKRPYYVVTHTAFGQVTSKRYFDCKEVVQEKGRPCLIIMYNHNRPTQSGLIIKIDDWEQHDAFSQNYLLWGANIVIRSHGLEITYVEENYN